MFMYINIHQSIVYKEKSWNNVDLNNRSHVYVYLEFHKILENEYTTDHIHNHR